MLDRIRDTNLGPEQFARTFSALLQGINLTNSPGLAITIDYGDGPVGPDELIPVITLSFRGNNDSPNQQTIQEILHEIDKSPSLQEAIREGSGKSPRKTTPKTPKTLAEVFQGECSPSTPQVRFDMPCETAAYDPSEFAGVMLTHTCTPPSAPTPVQGLERLRAMLSLFDGDLSVFDCWSARIDTNIGSYHLGGPRRIERDLRPGGERIRLDFITLPVIKHVYVRELVIFNGIGEPVAVKIVGLWLHPEDTLRTNYTLNV